MMGTDWKTVGSQLHRHWQGIAAILAIAVVGELAVLPWDGRLCSKLAGTAIMLPTAYLDAVYYRLYHRLTAGMLLIGLAMAGGMSLCLTENQLAEAAEGALLLGSLFLLLYLGTGQIGFGDVCYAAALGSFLGWQDSLVAFVMTFWLGMLAALREYLYYFLKKKWRHRVLPLGPFMAAGTYIAFLWGQELAAWYGKAV